MRFLLLLLSCLCTAGCGGCVDDSSPPPGARSAAPAPRPIATVAPRVLPPLPARAIQFLNADAGTRDD